MGSGPREAEELDRIQLNRKVTLSEKENKVGGGVEKKHCFRQVFNGTLEESPEINTFRFKKCVTK